MLHLLTKVQYFPMSICFTPGRQYGEIPTPDSHIPKAPAQQGETQSTRAELFLGSSPKLLNEESSSPKLLPRKEHPGNHSRDVSQPLSSLQTAFFSLLFIVNRTDNCLSLRILTPANMFFHFLITLEAPNQPRV